MITTTQMEYILAVAKEKNFRKAAESCFVTQPTLSVQIQKFEEELGTLIFDRSKTPVRLTQVGSKIVSQIQIAYNEILKIREVVEEESKEIKGELRIGVIPTISPYLIPLFLKSLNIKYPQLELSIFELTTENCLKKLENEEIDVAILATPENKKKFIQEDLYREDMLLYINPEHELLNKKKIYVEDLSVADLWLLEEGHCLRDEIIKFCHISKSMNKKPRNLNLKVGNLESLRFLVEENFGYTLLPYLSTLKLNQKEKKYLRPLQKNIPHRVVNLTKKRQHLKGAAINAIKEEILNSLPGEIKKIN